MKKLVFSVILALISYLVIEVFAYAAYRVKFGEFDLGVLGAQKQKAIESLNTAGVFLSQELGDEDVVVKPILHPYTGWQIDGKRRKPGCESEKPEDCYTRIKVATDKPLEKKAPNKLIVALLGGSFADGTASSGEQTLIRNFSRSERFKDYEVIIYNLAHGGYKQPQQLMHLAYYYALGAEFDFVINLDGFNEVAASYYNYRESAVHPAFPASWNFRVASSLNQDFLKLYSDKQQLLSSHARLASINIKPLINRSPLANFLWRIINQRFITKLSAIDHAVASSKKQDNRDFAYEALGPDYDFKDWDSFFEYTSTIWRNSSLALNALAEGQGAKYYHFLQPNQYIDGAKQLSEWERKNAVLPSGGYGNVYKQRRDHIVKQVVFLEQSGVSYYDLSYMFKKTPDTLYVDNCCHLNGKGYDMVVRKIVQTILAELDSEAALED